MARAGGLVGARRREATGMNRKERRARGKDRPGGRSQPVARRGDGPGPTQLSERIYRGILADHPEQIDALRALGVRTFQPGSAIEALGRALARDDLAPQLHYYMACAQAALGRLDLAGAHDQRAIALKPDFFDAYNHLALTFLHLGRVDDALGVLRRAIDIGANVESKRLFVQVLRGQRSIPDLDDLRELMARALSEPWCRPSEAAPIAVPLIKHHRALRPYIDHVKACWPVRPSAPDWLGMRGLIVVSGHRLLLSLLEAAPVCDLDLERFLTALRFVLLDLVSDASSLPGEERVLRLACALARQCFLNEYVFAHANDELVRARSLADRMAAAIASAAPIEALTLAVVASYFPLRSIPGAATLSARRWPQAVADLLVQQVEQPREEQQLRGSITALTAVTDPVSLEVQRQYEENPYPRWQAAEPPLRPTGVEQYLRARFPLAPLQDLGEDTDVEVLAGC
jgi:hypothetical protein